jgi:hypothetical protein
MPVDTTKSIPTVQQYGLEPGAKTPMESAQIKSANASAEQNANNQQAGSRKNRSRIRSRIRSRKNRSRKNRSRKKYKGGKGDQPGPNEIIVPQPTTLADPAGPVDANANTAASTETLTTSDAQAEYDNKVGQSAGRKRRRHTRKCKSRRSKIQIGCSNGGKKNNKQKLKRKSKYTRRRRNKKSKK